MRGKKLTPKEIEDKEIKKILKRIIDLEKHYSKGLIERACFRYKDANVRKRSAQKDIEELEIKLERAKRDLK